MIKKYGLASLVSFLSMLLTIVGYSFSFLEGILNGMDVYIDDELLDLFFLVLVAIFPLIAVICGAWAIFRTKHKNLFSYFGLALGTLEILFLGYNL